MSVALSDQDKLTLRNGFRCLQSCLHLPPHPDGAIALGQR